jgi:hypothetical protein
MPGEGIAAWIRLQGEGHELFQYIRKASISGQGKLAQQSIFDPA